MAMKKKVIYPLALLPNGCIHTLELPSRLFETGYEPTGKKRVNNYFNLRWIEVIKSALEDEDLTMLNASQFGQVLKMGSHTFSVMFLHYLLSRQLITEKDFELWWLFVGKPIRYAIQDFALVTGLNCGQIVDAHHQAKGKGARGKGTGKSTSSSASQTTWDVLFGKEDKPTTSWIIDRLVKGKKYKDPLTRLRLALLVLVEGILCPTCGTTNIRPEVVRKLDNLDEFLNYPWGRESFLLTVRSTKSRRPSHYVLQDTMAIQGFSHAMVLVTVAACPSILLKPGAVIPLDDESKSSEDIVNELLDRKFSVNVVSAKAVDQKGQAFVRSLIRSDEAGEELYRGLGDNEDEAVDHLVALARDDYPFEHNTWAGGVRADDVKANKGQALPSESSDEEELEETDREYRQQGGGDDVVHSGEGRGQPSMREGEARIGGRPTSAGVGDLVRQAAEAFEAQLLPMFEGYMVSMKDHISKELSKLMTEVASANSSIAAVETFVKTELATLRNGTAGVDMYGGDLFSGYSPAMRSPSHGPSSPSRQRNKGTADTRVDAEDSPQIDEVDGNAAIGKKSCPSEMAPGDPKSDPPESLIEEIVTGAMPTSSSGVDAFLDVSETDNPLSDTPPAASSSVVEVPSDVSHTNTKAAPGSTVDAIPTELPVLPSTIHEVQTDVSDTVSGPSAASIVEIVPTQSPTIEPKLHDVEDDVEGSVATEKDEVLTKKTTSKPRKAGRAVKLTTVVPTQVCRRYSKREHRSPDRYTPSEGPEKQEPGKRARRGAKEKQNVVASVAEPSIPIKETTSLIGGFTPFLPPNPVKRATFLEAMKDAKTQSAAKDSAFDVHTLMPLFDSSRVASEKAIDCVVAFIRKRRDAKEAFSFSPSLKKQFTDRPQWFTQVDILHIPVLMNKRQWVGIIVDLNMWAMSVVEANPGCPSEFEFTYLLTAASILFPHLIGRYCMTNHAQKRNFEPMTFSRLDMPCVVEHPVGCSAAVALMLLELHAVGKDVTVLKFTEEQVRTAGENYAVDALHLCQGVPIPFTQ
ncbi:unnamed protein product [Brassica napus]|uniref:(rape) hypothetical protein n=2 Tax=Brassica napus TaxID=3708 RepID=A0A816ZBW9_BRANA|nr:unnamed protein product [Brassica napus]